MAKAKRKLLPKDFETLLEQGDPERLRAVFDTCAVDARGGFGKQTALAFAACPDDLARWLVGRGADLAATDDRGNTPLHARARSWRGGLAVLIELGADIDSTSASIGTPLHAAADSHKDENARVLIGAGARVDALNRDGLTPLELALRGCRNADIEATARLAEALLAAGAARTPRMQEFVARIGSEFEFHRAGFNAERVDATDRALQRLYALFDVPAVPARLMHDGAATIAVGPGRWQDQHQRLWALLVPPSGHAATVQGEVVRISGRIAHELDGNGGINWDADFHRMADAFLGHVGSGRPLPEGALAEAAGLVAEAKRRGGEPARLCALAVAWVELNPSPLPLPPPDYAR